MHCEMTLIPIVDKKNHLITDSEINTIISIIIIVASIILWVIF